MAAAPGCVVENPLPSEDDGWTCTDPGRGACTRTNCGDGMQQGTEQCDDGNNEITDGCTSRLPQGPHLWHRGWRVHPALR